MNTKNELILLTGATGFLGSHLLKTLLEENLRVIILKRSFSDTDRIKDCLSSVRSYDADKTPPVDIFTANAITTVLHCATDYGRKHSNPLKIIDANLTMPLSLLYEGGNHGLRAFINTDTVLDKRVNHYALSKNQFAQWLELFSGKLTCVTIALEHFYGPQDDKTKFVSHIIASLLDNVPELALTKGEQKRDFIHIDDVCSGFMAVLRAAGQLPPRYTRFEMGTGRNIAVRDFVQMIQSLVGNTATRLDFGALPYRANEVMASSVDLSGMTALGWKPQIALEAGLRATIKQEKELRGL